MSVLGLGTPDVDRWIEAGKRGGEGWRERKGKMVGFMDENGEGQREIAEKVKEKENKSKESQALQISPLRPGPATTTSWVPSPLRNSTAAHLNLNAQSYAPSAPDLLRTIVRDVMYDFQRETKAEMMGLHLDLVRMGRGWRHELRSLMDEYIGDLKDLREENVRLREENARLRRGY
jgi:protein NEDD1